MVSMMKLFLCKQDNRTLQSILKPDFFWINQQ